MTHIDLFSGIGGFAYAAQQVWPDYQNLFFCEINTFCQAVLKKNFGDDVVIFDDIKNVTRESVWKRYAQDVKPENLLEKMGGVENVNPNMELNIITNTEKLESHIPKIDGGNRECRSLKHMAGSAFVAEKPNQNFLPLTINTEGGIKNEKNLEGDIPPISISSGRDSQKDSNCFATTAITQGDSMGNVPTKNREVNIEPVIADTNRNGSQKPRAEPEGRENISGGDYQVDLLTGGFPCQPFSAAGKRKGRDDDRHLWPEMFRVIKAFRPRWVIAENVRGLINIENGLAFEQVCLDLESIGYTVQAYIIPACAVNAPHRRDRIWIIGESKLFRLQHGCEEPKEFQGRKGTSENADRHAADTEAKGFLQSRQEPGKQTTSSTFGSEQHNWQQPWLEVATRLCRMDDGLPVELDGLKLSKSKHREERLKALGNAIVSQVVMEIMREIKLGGK